MATINRFSPAQRRMIASALARAGGHAPTAAQFLREECESFPRISPQTIRKLLDTDAEIARWYAEYAAVVGKRVERLVRRDLREQVRRDVESETIADRRMLREVRAGLKDKVRTGQLGSDQLVRLFTALVGSHKAGARIIAAKPPKAKVAPDSASSLDDYVGRGRVAPRQGDE